MNNVLKFKMKLKLLTKQTMKWIDILKLVIKTTCQILIITYILYRYTFKRFLKLNLTTHIMNTTSIKSLIFIELMLLVFLFLIIITLISLRQKIGYKTNSSIFLPLKKRFTTLLEQYFYQPLRYCDQVIENFIQHYFASKRAVYINKFLYKVYHNILITYQQGKFNHYFLIYFFY
jgi:hypothetical protein